mgnify:CR=1 FL=1
MRGTKIIVLRMKELIYTAIFAGVGIILLLLIVYLLEKGDQKVNKILLTQMKDIRQGYIRRISH